MARYQPKHAALGITAKLDLDIKQFAANLSKASTSIRDFAKNTAKPFKGLDKKMHTLGLGLRDIARIAFGIMISQAFYRGAQAITDATSALTEFNESLDYAQVTYTALFGSSDISSRFLETLKEQSIDTMYSFEDLTQASKKLLAYGIDYKNVAYITEGLGNLAAMSGDTAAMDRISYALGQIYAKGTLKAEEMRQLANAYVPIQQILKDSFNLTDDQLGNVGALRIPAEDAINAIVNYANTQFASVGKSAMLTITGLKSRITDTFKVMGNEMTQPITNAFKSFLAWFNNQLSGIRDAYKKGGSGGVLEYLVPDEGTRQLIRQFLATFHNMLMSTFRTLASLAPIVRTIISGFITVYNIIAPAITVINNVLAVLIGSIARSKVAMNVLKGAIIATSVALTVFAVKLAITKLIAMVTKGIQLLSKAVLFLSAALAKMHLSTLVIGGVTLALIALVASTTKGREAISRLADKFQGFMNGLKSDDILKVKDGMDQTAESSDEFSNALDSSGDSIDELADKAAKAKKGLLSFDEVFKLNDTNDEGTVDYDSVYENLNIPTTDSFLPEIGSFSDYTNAFASQLFSDLWNSVKNIAAGATSGLLVGSLVGFVIGGIITKTLAGALTGAKWGATIGTIAGGGFAAFWDTMSTELQTSLQNAFQGAAVGALVGGLTGFVLGAAATKTLKGALTAAGWGAAIASLLAGSFAGFWDSMSAELQSSIQAAFVGGATGALIGGLVGLIIGAFATGNLKGAIAGAKIGSSIGAVIGGAIGATLDDGKSTLEEKIKNAFGALKGTAVGALAGGLAGLVIGAFITGNALGAKAGATLGSSIGALMGAAIGGTLDEGGKVLTDKLSGMFSTVKAAGYGMFIGGLVGMIAGAIIGAFAGGVGALPGAKIGATIGAAAGGLIGAFIDYLDKIDFGTTLSNWFKEVGRWFSDTGAAIGNWFIGVGKDIKNWWGGMWTGIASGWSKLSGWFSTLKTNISSWFTSTKTSVKTWWGNMWTSMESGWSKTKTWFSTLKTNVSSWFTSTKTSVKSWWGSMWTGMESGWSKTKSWFSTLKTNVSTWFTSTKTSVKSWWGSLFDTSTWTSGWSKIKSWFTSLFNDIKSWFTSLGSNIGSWWDSLWSGKSVSASTDNGNTSNFKLGGHATGGIFNREHIARFAEGNKAEAVIPLQNANAMQPFVDAVSNGLLASLMPTLAVAGGSSSDLPPMYVGTLIADDKGLKELERKLKVIRVKEEKRGN